MQELQGQLKRLRQNNANIGDFKVKWRVKLKKRMNAVHVRNQKHELTPPRNSFSTRDIVYDQANQLSGLRDKPITQQDALPRSECQPRYLPGQDPLSLLEASPLSSCLVRSSKHQYRRS
ncbi:hypothetical protein V6N12_019251 [Hibiscus sabdariffa]|uniref:Uncharacterized protein n=1 Tax=Hibiscus sabdariffa TaxID=183260 RepID=A0ABR2C7Q0_9ROSI